MCDDIVHAVEMFTQQRDTEYHILEQHKCLIPLIPNLAKWHDSEPVLFTSHCHKLSHYVMLLLTLSSHFLFCLSRGLRFRRQNSVYFPYLNRAYRFSISSKLKHCNME
jgi:hypothetical protein